MSRSLRAQVSLIFSDEELYDNFVIPLKDNKELSGMIIKLLKSYYESEEIRNAVEGVSFENIVDGSNQIMDSNDAFDKINQMRQTLAMQDFLFEQAKMTLEDGATEMDALMRANDIAKKSGVVKTEHTDVGEMLVQLSLENPISESTNQKEQEPIDGSGLECRVTRIEESLNSIIDMLKNASFTQSTTSTPTGSDDLEEGDLSEIATSNVESQVPVSESNVVEDFSQEEPEEEISYQRTESAVSYSDTDIAEEIIEESVDDDDASSELSDLLKDLLG